ncbi:response regulator [Fundidesulfovibrio magnetotacticus]|uniref:response regulator n=1 Tax=Fundidesulfovibrio magnetotacticus TaxID=2730080 RepID=UPI0015667D09|nr:response regulator [Fundidesulfovibrio magnetotacticus]
MKALVVEDDFASRKLLQRILQPYGEADVAVNGLEAIEAFSKALEEGTPYDLVCMDIMMPEMDGQIALKHIRRIEKEKCITSIQEAKIIMTTALDDPKNVIEAYYKGGATSYVAKPIDKCAFIQLIKELKLIS